MTITATTTTATTSITTIMHSEGSALTAWQVMRAREADGRPACAPSVPDAARALRIHIIGSGSKGNAAIVENLATGEGVLVDCGLSKKAVAAGCAQTGFDLARLRAAVVTHDHSDHTKGFGVNLRGLRKLGVELPVYAAASTIEHASELRDCRDQGLFEHRALEAGKSIHVAGIEIHPFATSHDAWGSFGFRFEADAPDGTRDAIGYLTDSGIVTPAAHEALRDVRVLALESNHDLHMLRHGPYPRYLQDRVASERGHLSNDQAADELARLLSPRLSQVVAMHVSQNNNTYELPVEALARVLAREGHGACACTSYQARPIVVG